MSNKETLYKASQESELNQTEIKNLKLVLYNLIKEYLQTKKIHMRGEAPENINNSIQRQI